MKELRKSSLGLVAVMTMLANTGALANSRVVLNKTSATSNAKETIAGHMDPDAGQSCIIDDGRAGSIDIRGYCIANRKLS